MSEILNNLCYTGIASINGHLIGLRSDGSAIGIGYYYCNGPCGVKWNNLVAIGAGNDFVVGLTSQGNIEYDGYCPPYTPDWVKQWPDVVSITACANHVVALTSKGTVVRCAPNPGFSYPRNYLIVQDWSGIISIFGGDNCVFGLKEDGSVVATGTKKEWRRLSGVDKWRDIISIASSPFFTAGLKSDGTVRITGAINSIAKNEIKSWKQIKAIYTNMISGSILYGIKNDGTVVFIDTFNMNLYDHELREVKQWRNIIAIAENDYFVIGLTGAGKILFTPHHLHIGTIDKSIEAEIQHRLATFLSTQS